MLWDLLELDGLPQHIGEHGALLHRRFPEETYGCRPELLVWLWLVADNALEKHRPSLRCLKEIQNVDDQGWLDAEDRRRSQEADLDFSAQELYQLQKKHQQDQQQNCHRLTAERQASEGWLKNVERPKMQKMLKEKKKRVANYMHTFKNLAENLETRSTNGYWKKTGTLDYKQVSRLDGYKEGQPEEEQKDIILAGHIDKEDQKTLKLFDQYQEARRACRTFNRQLTPVEAPFGCNIRWPQNCCDSSFLLWAVTPGRKMSEIFAELRERGLSHLPLLPQVELPEDHHRLHRGIPIINRNLGNDLPREERDRQRTLLQERLHHEALADELPDRAHLEGGVDTQRVVRGTSERPIAVRGLRPPPQAPRGRSGEPRQAGRGKLVPLQLINFEEGHHRETLKMQKPAADGAL